MYTGFTCIKGSNPLLSVVLLLDAFYSFPECWYKGIPGFLFPFIFGCFFLRCTKCAQTKVSKVLVASEIPALFFDLQEDERRLFE